MVATQVAGQTIPTPVVTHTPTPTATSIPTSTPTSTPMFTPWPTPTPGVTPTIYEHPSLGFTIVLPNVVDSSGWEIEEHARSRISDITVDSPWFEDDTVRMVGKRPVERRFADVNVSLTKGSRCGEDSSSWADSNVAIWNNVRPYDLIFRQVVDIKGIKAEEVVYDVSNGTSLDLHLYLVDGSDTYSLTASTDLDLPGDSLGIALSFLESVLLTFEPSQPLAIPPQPPESALQVYNANSVLLLDGDVEIAGRVVNTDAFWWATDIVVSVELWDANLEVVWEAETTPNTEVIQPGGRAWYKFFVPLQEARYRLAPPIRTNVPEWEVFSVSWDWDWFCP